MRLGRRSLFVVRRRRRRAWALWDLIKELSEYFSALEGATKGRRESPDLFDTAPCSFSCARSLAAARFCSPYVAHRIVAFFFFSVLTSSIFDVST